MQNHISRGDFKIQLSNLLKDPNMVHWTDAELNLRINEALFNFGAFGYFKERGELIITSADRFYDLTTSLENIAGELILEKTLTYEDLIISVCYDLLETYDDVILFSEFSQDEIINTIDRKLDEFKLQTGLILSVDEFLVSLSIVDLGNEKLDFIRLAFKDVADDDVANHKYYKLFKEDESSLQSFVTNFNLTPKRRPKYFSRLFGSSNELRLYPPYNNTGFLHLITIDGRDKSVLATLATKLDIPNNFFPYIKFGVEMDLFLSETPMKDLQRAAYCQQRWKEGIMVGKSYMSVHNVEINGRNSNIATFEDLDNFSANWQNQTGIPTKLALGGYNLISTNKGVLEPTSLVLDATRNAIIPLNDGDFIQVKAEYVEAILNYCYHLCMLKEGFSDLSASNGFLNQFGNMAMMYNSKLSKELTSFEMINKSKKQERQNTRFNKEMENAATSSA